jgi:transposase
VGDPSSAESGEMADSKPRAALIASDSSLTEKASLLRSCKGVGPKNAQMILARLPEIGALDRRKIAALVGGAPITAKAARR